MQKEERRLIYEYKLDTLAIEDYQILISFGLSNLYVTAVSLLR